jgi:hypothetical protein|tara:strand:- start:2144 stop:2614 length:471 start_codon:yes stop_codon:yes gene_type:complete
VDEEGYQEITLFLPKPVSLNKFYAGGHFAIRTKHKANYWKEIESAMDTFDRFTMDKFRIDVKYNCRYDVDNAICCCKFMADYLRNHGYVVDDSPKYFEGQSTRYDETLDKNQFVAIIKGYGYKVVESDLLPSDSKNTQLGNEPVRKPARRRRKAKD